MSTWAWLFLIATLLFALWLAAWLLRVPTLRWLCALAARKPRSHRRIAETLVMARNEGWINYQQHAALVREFHVEIHTGALPGPETDHRPGIRSHFLNLFRWYSRRKDAHSR